MRIDGWRITWGIALGMLLFSAGAIVTAGVNEESIRMLVRATARVSVTLFLLTFIATSLQRFVPGDTSAWLLRNRRYIGVSFAAVHAEHLALLGVLGVWYTHSFVDRLNAGTVACGVLAYLFIAAMAATSSDAAVRAMGHRKWKLLHTVGAYYIWILFAQSYIPRAIKSAFYWPFAIALVGALALRITYVAVHKSKRVTEQTVNP